MANVDIQVTINTDSDIGDTTLVNKLKRYAIEQFGWTEHIPDPENEGGFMDNPISYAQVIFLENSMTQFKSWDMQTTFQDERSLVKADLESFHQSITASVETITS